MQKAVVCVVSNRDEAVEIISQLQAAGIANEEISAIFPNHGDGHAFARKYDIDVPDSAVSGGVAGGAAGAFVGGTIGLLAGVGALAIPGIGPLVAVGPIMALVAGAATGATVGSVAGGLISMGVPESRAKQLENKLRSGQILLSVHSESSASLEKADQIFKKSNVTDLTSAPASTRSPNS